MTTNLQDALAVFREARPRLFGIAYRMLGSAHEAEDIVQETFCLAVEKRDELMAEAERLIYIHEHGNEEEELGPDWIATPLIAEAYQLRRLDAGKLGGGFNKSGSGTRIRT